MSAPRREVDVTDAFDALLAGFQSTAAPAPAVPPSNSPPFRLERPLDRPPSTGLPSSFNPAVSSQEPRPGSTSEQHHSQVHQRSFIAAQTSPRGSAASRGGSSLTHARQHASFGAGSTDSSAQRIPQRDTAAHSHAPASVRPLGSVASADSTSSMGSAGAMDTAGFAKGNVKGNGVGRARIAPESESDDADDGVDLSPEAEFARPSAVVGPAQELPSSSEQTLMLPCAISDRVGALFKRARALEAAANASAAAAAEREHVRAQATSVSSGAALHTGGSSGPSTGAGGSKWSIDDSSRSQWSLHGAPSAAPLATAPVATSSAKDGRGCKGEKKLSFRAGQCLLLALVLLQRAQTLVSAAAAAPAAALPTGLVAFTSGAALAKAEQRLRLRCVELELADSPWALRPLGPGKGEVSLRAALAAGTDDAAAKNAWTAGSWEHPSGPYSGADPLDFLNPCRLATDSSLLLTQESPQQAGPTLLPPPTAAAALLLGDALGPALAAGASPAAAAAAVAAVRKRVADQLSQGIPLWQAVAVPGLGWRAAVASSIANEEADAHGDGEMTSPLTGSGADGAAAAGVAAPVAGGRGISSSWVPRAGICCFPAVNIVTNDITMVAHSTDDVATMLTHVLLPAAFAAEARWRGVRSAERPLLPAPPPATQAGAGQGQGQGQSAKPEQGVKIARMRLGSQGWRTPPLWISAASARSSPSSSGASTSSLVLAPCGCFGWDLPLPLPAASQSSGQGLSAARSDAGIGDDDDEGDKSPLMSSVASFLKRSLLFPVAQWMKLFPHQRETLCWLWGLHRSPLGGAVLGDDMGLGKTVQIAAFVGAMWLSEAVKRVCIIVPLATVGQWEAEMRKWAPGVSVYSFLSSLSSSAKKRALDKVVKEGGVLLTTPDMMTNNQAAISFKDRDTPIMWDYAISDEAHRFKNHTTQRAKSFAALPSRHRVLLTGTPLQNVISEVWSVFSLATGGRLFGTHKEFLETFEKPIHEGLKRRTADSYSSSATVNDDASNALSLLRLRLYPVFLRRDKLTVQAAEAAAKAYEATISLGAHATATASASIDSSAVSASGKANAPSDKPVSLSGVSKTELVLWVPLSPAQRRLYSCVLRTAAVGARRMTSRSPLATLTLLKKLCDHPRLLDPTIDYIAATAPAANGHGGLGQGADEGEADLDMTFGGSTAVGRGRGRGRERIDDDFDDDGNNDDEEGEEDQGRNFTTAVVTQALRSAPLSVPTDAEAAHDAEYDAVLRALMSPSDLDSVAVVEAAAAAAAAASAPASAAGSSWNGHLNSSVGLHTVASSDAAAGCTSVSIALAAAAPRGPDAVAAVVAPAVNAVAARAEGVEAYDKSIPMEKYVKDVSVVDLVMESAKMRVLASLLLTLSASGHRTLVFSQSRQMLDVIARLVVALGLAYERIDGLVPQAERDQRMSRFQSQAPETPAGSGHGGRVRAHVCLLTTQAGGVGLNLTGADRVIIVDPAWNPATDAQAVDRSYRLGQRKDVVAYRLVTVGTVEEVIYRKQVFKGSLHRAAVADDGRGGRMGKAHFTAAELKEVFAFKSPLESDTAANLSAAGANNALLQREKAAIATKSRAQENGFNALYVSDYHAPFDPVLAPARSAGVGARARRGRGRDRDRSGDHASESADANAGRAGDNMGSISDGRREIGASAGSGTGAGAGTGASGAADSSSRAEAAAAMRSAARSVRSAARAAERGRGRPRAGSRDRSGNRSRSRGQGSQGGSRGGSRSASRGHSGSDSNEGSRDGVRSALVSALGYVGDAAAHAANVRGHSQAADVLKFLTGVLRDNQHS